MKHNRTFLDHNLFDAVWLATAPNAFEKFGMDEDPMYFADLDEHLEWAKQNDKALDVTLCRFLGAINEVN